MAYKILLAMCLLVFFRKSLLNGLCEISDYLPYFRNIRHSSTYREGILEINEFCQAHGYNFENHILKTQDGYSLNIHRVNEKQLKGNKTSRKYPVLLLHGFSCTSWVWIDSKDDSLGFNLAHNGYDVWLGNFRGNDFTTHEKYSRDTDEYWDYSYSEFAKYDLPSMIDYILLQTGATKIILIGHSQGCLTSLAFLSSNIKNQEKVLGLIALAPFGNAKYTPNFCFPPARLFMPYFRLIRHRLVNVGVPAYLLYFLSDFDLTSLPLGIFSGYSLFRNKTRDFIILNHRAKKASSREFRHLVQMTSKEGTFMFDYGKDLNKIKYNKVFPPAYDLASITVPIAIFYSANDPSSNPIDIAILRRKLHNVVAFELIKDPMFAHDDFINSVNAKQLYQNKLLNILNDLKYYE